MRADIPVAPLLIIAIIAIVTIGVIEWTIGSNGYVVNAPKIVSAKPSVPAVAPPVAQPPVTDPIHAQWLQEAEDARDLLDRALPDYPTTRFKDVHGILYLPALDKTHYVLCGLLNTKNAMGAYTGWIRFAVEYTSENEMSVNIASTDDAETIVSSLCDGHGRAGEQLVAKQHAEKTHFLTLTPSEEGDEVIREMEEARNSKPWPMLPAKIDRETDYSDDIHWRSSAE